MKHNDFYTVTRDSTQHFAKKESGIKGYNLYQLATNGIKVPKFVILPSHFFEEFKRQCAIDQYLQKILIEGPVSMLDVSQKIRKKIIEASMPVAIYEEIIRVYEQLKKELISVRAAPHNSFIDETNNFLYLCDVESIIVAIKECWAKAYSERSLHFHNTHKLDNVNIKMSVILQEMVDPDVSGILLQGNQLFIKSTYGIFNEGMAQNLDTYVLEKNSGVLSEVKIVEKIRQLKKIETTVPLNEQNAESLTAHHLHLLHETSKKIDNIYAHPQDIHWAIKDNELHILQVKAAKDAAINEGGILYLWDSSSVVENYGGPTTPLTFGFSQHFHHQVHLQFCEILLIPQKRIKEMDHFLRSTIGYFHGRIYCNLLNWHKLHSLFPGRKYNSSLIDTMMGNDEALQTEITQRASSPSFHKTITGRISSILTGLKFIYFHLNSKNIIEDFLDEFHQTHDKFRAIDYTKLSSDKIYEHYLSLEKEILWKWHAPIISDFLYSLHYEMFQKMTKLWQGNLGDFFHQDLLSGSTHSQAMLPTKRLIELANHVSKKPELRELLLSTNNDLCLEAINQSPFQEFYHLVLEYIQNFGFHCIGEMKLEKKDLHLDASLFFVFLKNLINNGKTDLEFYEKIESDSREKAQAQLEKNISGIKKLFYQYSLKQVKKAAINMDLTNLCRIKTYSIVRAMFYAIGEDFAKSDIIDNKEDIFFLSLEELRGALVGASNIHNQRVIIDLRKIEFENHKEQTPAVRFATRGATYWSNSHIIQETNNEDVSLGPKFLRGAPCFPGVIEGIVKVINDSSEEFNLNGEILVAERIDSGHAPLFPAISALLVENSGHLNPSILIAREMGIPTIVGIKGLTKKLKTGMKVRMNGETGLIEIL